MLNHYIEKLNSKYPSAAEFKGGPQGLRESVGPIISNHTIELPTSVYAKVQSTVRDLYAYAKSPGYLSWLIEEYKRQGDALAVEILEAKTKNNSILMAYDFHYEPISKVLSLIEINTNASAFLFSDLVYRATRTSFLEDKTDPLDLFLKAVENESQLTLGRKAKNIAIIDEDLDKQKMFLEFLMYRDLFKANGYSAEIFDYKDVPLNGAIDFIYNRYCDFTLSEGRSAHLRRTLLDGKICISPHPKEYLLLAHKERLIHFAEKNLSDTLIPTFLLDEKTDATELWTKRKGLFFKPRALYGAKATYKGSSISHKTFEKLFAKDSPLYLAQEFRPAGENNGFKFDLRFYAYEDQIHLGIARVYQGQVTNFNTPGGGFAP
ncbi:MAG: hypothetical protein AABZ31_00015, partial [Bdellovibrionota bacterium]